jgi:hypothetical protein
MCLALLQLSASLLGGGQGRTPLPDRAARPLDRSFPLGRIAFSLLPLAGIEQRVTTQQEIVRNEMWTLDQLQGVLAVNVPVRATVIKLSTAAGGGLLIHNPVAPTDECVELVKRLEARHGPVRHIVLGTLGLEHKAFVGPFSKCFNKATVWTQPGQWSWPLPLPLPLLGFPTGGRLKELPLPGGADDAALPEWYCDLEYKVLGPLCISTLVGGYFGESAFYHRPTSTLLVTDAVVQVDDRPPQILQEDPTCLLYHARDDISEEVQDTPEDRKRGWRRIVQFGLFFFPSAIDVKLSTIPSDLKRQPTSMRLLAETEGALPFGILPWAWARDDTPSFKALQGGLLCAPILQAIILNRFPEETRAWVEEVCQWRFRRVVPCHLANDVKARPEQFRKAFAFLDEDSPTTRRGQPQALVGDFELLAKASGVLTRLGVIGPPTAGQLMDKR